MPLIWSGTNSYSTRESISGQTGRLVFWKISAERHIICSKFMLTWSLKSHFKGILKLNLCSWLLQRKLLAKQKCVFLSGVAAIKLSRELSGEDELRLGRHRGWHREKEGPDRCLVTVDLLLQCLLAWLQVCIFFSWKVSTHSTKLDPASGSTGS